MNRYLNKCFGFAVVIGASISLNSSESLHDKSISVIPKELLNTRHAMKIARSNGGSFRDDPQSRMEWERLRLANPVTGEVPDNIIENSLTFAKSKENSVVYGDDGLPNIPLGPGGGSTDVTWSPRGPFNVGGRTRALAIDASDMSEETFLAGGVSGGMWRTTDAGNTWTKTTGSSEIHSVTAVAQDPNANNIWYYSTGELVGNSASGEGSNAFFLGDGVYKSTDDGVTWSILPNTQSNTPTSLSFDSFEGSYSIVVSGDQNMDMNTDVFVAVFGGIQRSQDGGDNWSEVLDGGDASYSDIIVTGDGTLYATLSDNAVQEGLFRSDDGGDSWQTINLPAAFSLTPDRIVLDYSRQDNNVIYVLANTPGEGTLDHMLFKYTHDGMPDESDWDDRTANIPSFTPLNMDNVDDFDSQNSYDLYVKVSPADENLVFLGGTNIYRSTDGFASTDNTTWIGGYSTVNDISVYPGHHPDQHALLFFSDPNKVLSGHDGGVSITGDITANPGGDNPVTWNSLNNGYLTTQAYTVAIDPNATNDSKILSGFQDNGTWFTSSSSLTTSWSENLTGDGSFCAFANDGLIRYVSAQNGIMFRYEYADENDPGDSPTGITRIDPSLGSGFLFINPFILNKNDDEIMYVAGGTSIWRNNSASTATTSTGWEEFTSLSATGSVSALDVGTDVPDRLYYGTSSGEIYVIADASLSDPSDADIFTGKGLPSAYVSSIFVDPLDADNVFVTFSNYEVSSIWSSTDGGASWVDISGDLEENPDGSGNGPSVRWFSAINNGTDCKHFVATSTGVYSTVDISSPNPGTSPVWTLEDPDGIGNVVVDMIATRNSDGMIVAATHANGLYSAQFPAAAGTLNPPINVAATAISSSAIQLTWTDNSTIETGYVIERSTSATGGFVEVEEGQQSAPLTSFTDNGLPVEGQTFYYRVATTDGVDMSDYSVVVSATTFGSDPPSGLMATSVSAVSATLEWTDNTQSESEFEIERSTDGMNFSFVGDVDADVTTFTNIGLSAETDYYYQVRARVDGVLTDPSNVEMITTTAPTLPNGIPSNLNATVLSSSEIRINWGDQSTNETGFTVERSDFIDGLYKEVATVGAGVTTFTSSGLLPGTTYYFRVLAFNEEGSTDPSNTVSATTDVSAPDAPTELTAVSVLSTEVSITWRDNSLSETAYEVQVSTDDVQFSTVATLDPDTEAFTITGLSEATSYSIRVLAINITGETPSGVIKVTTPQSPPEAPSDLSISIGADGTAINLIWTDNANNEDGFILERSFEDVENFEELAELPPNDNAFQDTIEPDVNAFYRVKAFNQGGDSDYSNITGNVLATVEPSSSNAVSVYPNPTSGLVRVDLGRQINSSGMIRIFDYTGRVYMSTQLTKRDHLLDLASLHSGMYMIEVTIGDTKAVRKVILSK